MKCYINDVNFIRLLLLRTELFKFKFQKYGQILCVHKPGFLMPVHISYCMKPSKFKVQNNALSLFMGKTKETTGIKNLMHLESYYMHLHN